MDTFEWPLDSIPFFVLHSSLLLLSLYSFYSIWWIGINVSPTSGLPYLSTFQWTHFPSTSPPRYPSYDLNEPSRSIPYASIPPSLLLSPSPPHPFLGSNPHSLTMSSSICAFEPPLNMLFVHLFNRILIKLLYNYIYEKWNHKSNGEENNGNYWKKGRDSIIIDRYFHRLPYSVSFPRVLYDIGWIEFTIVSRGTNENIFLKGTANWSIP